MMIIEIHSDVFVQNVIYEYVKTTKHTEICYNNAMVVPGSNLLVFVTLPIDWVHIKCFINLLRKLRDVLVYQSVVFLSRAW